jgi:hypothetical protein
MAEAGCSEILSAGENCALCLSRSNLMSSATEDSPDSCVTFWSMLSWSSSSCKGEGGQQAQHRTAHGQVSRQAGKQASKQATPPSRC